MNNNWWDGNPPPPGSQYRHVPLHQFHYPYPSGLSTEFYPSWENPRQGWTRDNYPYNGFNTYNEQSRNYDQAHSHYPVNCMQHIYSGDTQPQNSNLYSWSGDHQHQQSVRPYLHSHSYTADHTKRQDAHYSKSTLPKQPPLPLFPPKDLTKPLPPLPPTPESHISVTLGPRTSLPTISQRKEANGQTIPVFSESNELMRPSAIVRPVSQIRVPSSAASRSQIPPRPVVPISTSISSLQYPNEPTKIVPSTWKSNESNYPLPNETQPTRPSVILSKSQVPQPRPSQPVEQVGHTTVSSFSQSNSLYTERIRPFVPTISRKSNQTPQSGGTFASAAASMLQTHNQNQTTTEILRQPNFQTGLSSGSPLQNLIPGRSNPSFRTTMPSVRLPASVAPARASLAQQIEPYQNKMPSPSSPQTGQTYRPMIFQLNSNSSYVFPNSLTVATTSPPVPPKQIPCEIRDDHTFFIFTKYLPLGAHRGLKGIRGNSYDGAERWYFKNKTYSRVNEVLLSLYPALTLAQIPELSRLAARSHSPSLISSSFQSHLLSGEGEDHHSLSKELPETDLQTENVQPIIVNNMSPPPLQPPTSRNTKYLEIPGYQVVQVVVNPFRLTRSQNGVLIGSVKLDINPSQMQILKDKTRREMLILRLGLTKDGIPLVDGERILVVDRIQFRGNTWPLGMESDHFSIDITAWLNNYDGKEGVTHIFAKLDKGTEDDCIYGCICIVVKMNAKQMIQHLATKKQISVETTKAMVKEKLIDDMENGISMSDTLATSLLNCPIGKAKIVTPTRGRFCNHYACFDAWSFLQTYERMPNWFCPNCDMAIDYEDLRVDSYFQQILSLIGDNVNNYDVKIMPDGMFVISNHEHRKGNQSLMTECSEEVVEVLDSDEDDVQNSTIFNLNVKDEGILVLPPPPCSSSTLPQMHNSLLNLQNPVVHVISEKNKIQHQVTAAASDVFNLQLNVSPDNESDDDIILLSDDQSEESKDTRSSTTSEYIPENCSSSLSIHSRDLSDISDETEGAASPLPDNSKLDNIISSSSSFSSDSKCEDVSDDVLSLCKEDEVVQSTKKETSASEILLKLLKTYSVRVNISKLRDEEIGISRKTSASPPRTSRKNSGIISSDSDSSSTVLISYSSLSSSSSTSSLIPRKKKKGLIVEKLSNIEEKLDKLVDNTKQIKKYGQRLRSRGEKPRKGSYREYNRCMNELETSESEFEFETESESNSESNCNKPPSRKQKRKPKSKPKRKTTKQIAQSYISK